MKVNGTHYRSIWYDHELSKVKIIDQRWLPHDFKIVELETLQSFATAIKDMWVRGAPLIGATAAYGVAVALEHDASDNGLKNAYDTLTVSYTHLRAHETPEHLVCRLLLEKKKGYKH